MSLGPTVGYVNPPDDTRRTMEDRALRVPEVAQRLGISRTKAWQMARAGELPTLRLGRSVRVPVSALARWIEEQTNDPKAA
jgi:excisionase family DNA binding protein